jgi:YD repeat-containing protein
MSIKLKIYGTGLHHNDHFLLDGLDRVNQHPIEAIIGLVDELNKRYIKPVTGIPDSDLAERYINEATLNTTVVYLESLYAKNSDDITTLNNEYNLLNTTLMTDENDIRFIKTQYELIKNRLDSLPVDLSNPNPSGTHIEQRIFTADDTNKVFNIAIIDTDLKVIEPTILKSDSTLAVAGVDYTISYPDDVTMAVTFVNNGVYKINYISGALTDTEFNILLKYMNDIKHQMAIGMAGSGSILHPMADVQLIYDSYGRLIQEQYTGDVTKTVDYAYDSNGNISTKTVTQGGIIKVATYLYDATGKLITIEDEGTDIPVNGTKPRSYQLTIDYGTNGQVAKETYTGDIVKTVEYEYSQYGDITKKTVTENGITRSATYIYDQNHELIKIEDEGTESIAIVFPSDYTGGSGSGGTVADIEIISDPEIDLIFDTIFVD